MNEGPVFTINARKFDHSIHRSWTARLIEHTEKQLVFEGVFDQDVEHCELGHIVQGTVSTEYYWLDQWYSVFRFQEPTGGLRNFYGNINMPPTFAHSTLDYVDLDIDVVVWPDRSFKVLDIDEFEENARLFAYPEAVRAQAAIGLEKLITLINSGDLPT